MRLSKDYLHYSMAQPVALKELRQNTKVYIRQVKKGNSFIVYRRSEPLFRIVPLQGKEQWEEVIDFTKLKKGGVRIEDVLKRL